MSSCKKHAHLSTIKTCNQNTHVVNQTNEQQYILKCLEHCKFNSNIVDVLPAYSILDIGVHVSTPLPWAVKTPVSGGIEPDIHPKNEDVDVVLSLNKTRTHCEP